MKKNVADKDDEAVRLKKNLVAKDEEILKLKKLLGDAKIIFEKESDELKQEIGKHETENKKLQERLSILEKEKLSWKKEYENISKELVKLEDKVKSNNKQVDNKRLKDENSELKLSVQNLQKDIKEKENALTTCKDD